MPKDLALRLRSRLVAQLPQHRPFRSSRYWIRSVVPPVRLVNAADVVENAAPWLRAAFRRVVNCDLGCRQIRHGGCMDRCYGALCTGTLGVSALTGVAPPKRVDKGEKNAPTDTRLS